MADKLGTLDLQSLIAEEMPGAKFAGKGEKPGTIKLIVPEGVKDPVTGVYKPDIEVDLNAMLKEDGVDPSQLDIQYNTKDTAIDDSPLGFVDRIKYEVARTPVNKAKFLKDKYGSESIKFDPNSSSFKVIKDGVWHNADKTGIAGFLGGEGDVIAGSVAGGKAGASVGALAGPAGAVAGGLIGSGVGAVVARLGTMEAAKAAGLRSEQDAKEVMRELGKEAILAMGGEAVGLGLKAGTKLLSSSVRGIASKATSPLAKREAAYTMEAATGVPFVDNMTWLDHPSEVGNLQQKVINWEAAGTQGINPVKKEMADAVQEAVEMSKADMYKKYNSTLEPLKPITKELDVDIQPVINDLQAQYKDMGLIDHNNEWIPKGEAELQKVVNPTSVKRLRETYDIIKRGAKKAEDVRAISDEARAAGLPLSFDDTRTLIKNMDEILEAAGQYNMGPVEITTPAKARIVGIRANLNNQLISSLEKKNPEAAALYKKMNSDFSKRREWIDDVASGIKDEKIDSTMKRLLGPDGDRSRELMSEVLRDTGIDAEQFMNKLYQGRAALNSTKLYKSAGVGNIVGGQMRLTSPQRTTPLVAKTFNALKGMSEATNFIGALPKDQRVDLLRSPDMMRAIRQITVQAIDGANNGADALIQQALQQTMPGPTPVIPQDDK